MKFASFTHQGRTGYGAITDRGVIALSPRHAATWPTLKQVIEQGALPRLTDLAAALAPEIAEAEITYGIPIPAPEKILCVGVNFFPTAMPNTRMAPRTRPICRCSRVLPAALPATTSH